MVQTLRTGQRDGQRNSLKSLASSASTEEIIEALDIIFEWA
jgi:hypothetical protein